MAVSDSNTELAPEFPEPAPDVRAAPPSPTVTVTGPETEKLEL